MKPGEKPAALAERYRGTTATQYEERRTSEPSWAREQVIVSSMVEAVPAGGTLLDVPVGTGRFFEYYRARGLEVTGVDVSADMLVEARRKAAATGLAVTLEEGDIRRLRFPTASFDGAVCIRLFNLIPLPDVRQALGELARVSRRHVILGVRWFAPMRELVRRPGRTGLVARQLARRLRAMARPPVLHVHQRAEVLDAFTEQGLAVVRAASAEQFRDGSELVVYLLEKCEGRQH